MVPFDAGLIVEGFDEVLFDAGRQFSFQTVLFVQMYHGQVGQWA